MTRREEVLLVVPPNSNTVLPHRPNTVTRPEELSDWSAFASLGALSLASAVNAVPPMRGVYLDGSVLPPDAIRSYITGASDRILAVGISTVTANYEAGLSILHHVKQVDPRIVTVAGGHHVSALARECLSDGRIDVGFVGNDAVRPFTALVRDLHAGRRGPDSAYPGLVRREGGVVRFVGPAPEPVFGAYDYELLRGAFDHRRRYDENFRQRVAPRVGQLSGRRVTRGVPVDIGRGCIKFAADDACSFCSIHPGAQWRTQPGAADAWHTLETAWRNGYDYLYVTADELPLTFYPLLRAMRAEAPPWWTDLSPDERPVLVGYARADGMSNERRVGLLVDLGFRQVMIGLDAASPLSLAALNKPRRSADVMREAVRLFEQNRRAVAVARRHGMMIRGGFVLGHLGMTADLLAENVERITDIIDSGPDVFSAIDVEILLPEPGSRDFAYLTNPPLALAAARRLGLPIDADRLDKIAGRWRGRHITPPEEAMGDYVEALMPELSVEALAAARTTVRTHAQSRGIAIGE